jgi:molybdopterin molybdotransferase
MAQLSRDSFAFGGQLMRVAEAIALIEARLSPLDGMERLPLLDCDGRVLAEPLLAPVPLPPFDNSAVDGYAVRFNDLTLNAATTLPLGGRLAAGESAGLAYPDGVAVRIFTGAPMPEGFDTVFMQEDVTLEGERHVNLPPGLKRGANRRPTGEDIARGALAIPAGRRLGPRDIALAAALGQVALPVRRRLRVAVFSTGNEVIAPGKALRPASLYDSNRFVLQSLVRRLGAEVTDLGILPDRRETIAAALRQAGETHDLILTSGGVSTGEEDHVKGAVEDAGALTFWRIGIKPGRPVAMGVVGGAALIGLPGNPVAVFVTFAHIVRPVMARLGGAEIVPLRTFPVLAGFAYAKKEGRREYVRVSLDAGEGGRLTAHKHPRDGAGVITSLTETDGLVELPEEVTRVAPGDTVGFIPYSEML